MFNFQCLVQELDIDYRIRYNVRKGVVGLRKIALRNVRSEALSGENVQTCARLIRVRASC